MILVIVPLVGPDVTWTVDGTRVPSESVSLRRTSIDTGISSNVVAKSSTAIGGKLTWDSTSYKIGLEGLDSLFSSSSVVANIECIPSESGDTSTDQSPFSSAVVVPINVALK